MRLITSTNIISTPIVIEKQINADFNDVNLNILIHAITIQTATTSFNIQFFPENHHAQHTPIPTNKLIISNILILIEYFSIVNTLILKNSNLFNKYNN